MAPGILGIGTAVPPTRVSQSRVRDVLAAQPGLDRRARRLLDAAFAAAAIDTRHTVLGEIDSGRSSGLQLRQEGLTLRVPSTGERNDEYRRVAPELFAGAARDALARTGIAPSEVTHLITVSCTGMFAPGPDYLLVRDLGLSPATERYHLGFIGCAAALPGLRAASRIATAQPDAVVLVVAAELCSLHIRSSTDPEQIVAASIFADGAAAAVVTADPLRLTGRHLELGGFGTRLTADGEDDMVWTIGDEGFEMTLTAQVPRIVGREIGGLAGELFGSTDAVDTWAVHPGGRSILDRVEDGLALPADALDASRAILREYGNMSSATVLFVLQRLMDDPARREGERIAALAFGPGLTVEAARLTVRGAEAGSGAGEEQRELVADLVSPR